MSKTKIGKMMDDPLRWYLDYVNNFITYFGWCDHHGLTLDEGEYIVKEGKRLLNAKNKRVFKVDYVDVMTGNMNTATVVAISRDEAIKEFEEQADGCAVVIIKEVK